MKWYEDNYIKYTDEDIFGWCNKHNSHIIRYPVLITTIDIPEDIKKKVLIGEMEVVMCVKGGEVNIVTLPQIST